MRGSSMCFPHNILTSDGTLNFFNKVFKRNFVARTHSAVGRKMIITSGANVVTYEVKPKVLMLMFIWFRPSSYHTYSFFSVPIKSLHVWEKGMLFRMGSPTKNICDMVFIYIKRCYLYSVLVVLSVCVCTLAHSTYMRLFLQTYAIFYF